MVKFNTCVGCPSCEYLESDNTWFCRELQKEVDERKIDPDCPLEDDEDVAELREKAAKWDKVKKILK